MNTNWLETLTPEAIAFYENESAMGQCIIFQIHMAGLNEGLSEGIKIGNRSRHHEEQAEGV